MNVDFKNDFIGSLAYTVFTFVAGLTLFSTFVYTFIDTGSFFASTISAVTIGLIGGIFFGLVATFTSFGIWILFVLGRSIYFYFQRRAQLHKAATSLNTSL